MQATVLQAYKFALDPNDVQLGLLRSSAGARRFAYNWGLARVKAALAQREAEKTYGITAEKPKPPGGKKQKELAGQGTPWTEPEPPAEGWLTEVPWTRPELRKAFNAVKDTVAPWWREVSKEAFSDGFAGLAAALENYSASRKGTRAGRAVAFPRFRKRGKARDSFRYTTGSYGPAGGRHFRLPRIGAVRTHEDLGVLDGAVLKGVTVSRTAQRWFISCTVEVSRDIPAGPRRRKRGGVVGVDLGIKSLAVLSTGEVVPPGSRHKQALGKLRKVSRDYARTRPGSRNRAKQARRLARVHAGIAAARADDLHKLTTRLARDYEVVAIEDLNVSGMARSRSLARAVSDAAFGEFRRQLEYKCGTVKRRRDPETRVTEDVYVPGWHGARLHVAGRFYPSSKTCSGCGWRKASLKLPERTYACDHCGLVIDRDLNAAVNLKNHYTASTAGRACGATRKTNPAHRAGRQEAVKQEAGTPADKTSSPTG